MVFSPITAATLALMSASPAAIEPASTAQPTISEPPAFAAALAGAPARPTRESASQDYQLSYTFVEVSYFSTDIDAIDENTDGYGARGSLGLFEFLYVFLDYAREDVDFGNDEATADSFGLGVGAHLDLTPKLHAVGEVSWVYDDLSSDTVAELDESDDGFTAFAGARWLVLPWERGGLELNGGFRWIDRKALLSEEETAAWEVGARLHFVNHLSVGLGYQFLEDDARYSAGLRFSF